jgi:hypothetical protein
MGGRRRLRGGFRVWLPDHRKADGVAYRRCLRAGLELAGGEGLGGSELVRLEIERFARASLLLDQAQQHWAALLHQRQTGKGRRPSERRVERAARRVGLQEIAVKEATARLEQLAARTAQAGPSLEQIRGRYAKP